MTPKFSYQDISEFVRHKEKKTHHAKNCATRGARIPYPPAMNLSRLRRMNAGRTRPPVSQGKKTQNKNSICAGDAVRGRGGASRLGIGLVRARADIPNSFVVEFGYLGATWNAARDEWSLTAGSNTETFTIIVNAQNLAKVSRGNFTGVLGVAVPPPLEIDSAQATNATSTKSPASRPTRRADRKKHEPVKAESDSDSDSSDSDHPSDDDDSSDSSDDEEIEYDVQRFKTTGKLCKLSSAAPAARVVRKRKNENRFDAVKRRRRTPAKHLNYSTHNGMEAVTASQLKKFHSKHIDRLYGTLV